MNLNFLYSNPDDITQQTETDALIASNYYGQNSLIRKLQRVLTYLEKRRVRKNEPKRLKKLASAREELSKAENEKEKKTLTKKVERLSQPTYQKINLGQLVFKHKENAWYFHAVNGEKFRIPEPENGIEELFEVEYKRVKV